jgi:phosphoglycolate phosphatase-like HAD superfamily hydrolase
MKIHKIIFDFDGVVLNSHNIKTKAFYKIFLQYGKRIALKAKKYHETNTGISRYVKFKYILKKFLKKKITKNELDKLNHKFKKICLDKILKLKVPKLLLNFIKKRDEKYHLFISTGTPHNEIKKILKIKKIFKYFKGVYGSPDNKIQHIKKILRADKNAIFIGDSMEDYKSAKYMNINFILKVHKENKNILRGKNIFKIKNYKNFNKILNNFYNDY